MIKQFKMALTIGLVLYGFCLGADDSGEKVKLHKIFGDNMVVQRDLPVPVWGTAAPGKKVTVKLDSQEKNAVADETGKWKVSIDPLKAGGPYTMTVSDTAGNAIKLSGILSGDVWICSGQSNMEFSMTWTMDSRKEIAEAKYPEVRFFTVQKAQSTEPLECIGGSWSVCTPENAPGFSAVGYFFARELYKELNVPIGMIHSSWGGSEAASWTPSDAFSLEEKNAMKKTHEEYLIALDKWRKACAGKIDANDRHLDPGNKGVEKGWARPDFDDKDWKEMNIPGFFDRGNGPEMKIDGAVWFRKHVEIPASLDGKDLVISLGSIDDLDITYFNGAQVGAVGVETPQYWFKERRYEIPASSVKRGQAVIAVRVFDNFGGGGFTGRPENIFLSDKDEKWKISLCGGWKYFVEYAVMERPVPIEIPAFANLYNAMINPLLSFPIKGAIWYQGEANTGRASDYCALMSAMITGWRTKLKVGDFPFYIVQLASFTLPPAWPGESEWAELREAQFMTAKKNPNCGVATAVDLGDAQDIHPRNKQEVGRRLALVALKNTYGKNIVATGPVYEGFSVEGNRIRIKFKEIGGGLVAKNGEPLKQFSIAGEDGRFEWANVEIDGGTVLVWSDKIPKPAAVRYAWANNPEGANFYNKDGLPAFPFRTDNWPGITAHDNATK